MALCVFKAGRLIKAERPPAPPPSLAALTADERSTITARRNLCCQFKSDGAVHYPTLNTTLSQLGNALMSVSREGLTPSEGPSRRRCRRAVDARRRTTLTHLGRAPLAAAGITQEEMSGISRLYSRGIYHRRITSMGFNEDEKPHLPPVTETHIVGIYRPWLCAHIV